VQSDFLNALYLKTLLLYFLTPLYRIKGLKEEDWADRNNWRRKIA
jgi:hypothetical protein